MNLKENVLHTTNKIIFHNKAIQLHYLNLYSGGQRTHLIHEMQTLGQGQLETNKTWARPHSHNRNSKFILQRFIREI